MDRMSWPDPQGLPDPVASPAQPPTGRLDLPPPPADGVYRCANLRGISLSGANLLGVDMSFADLDEADLRRADLRRANLFGASLQGVRLQGARYDCDTVWPAGFDPRAHGARCLPRLHRSP